MDDLQNYRRTLEFVDTDYSSRMSGAASFQILSEQRIARPAGWGLKFVELREKDDEPFFILAYDYRYDDRRSGQSDITGNLLGMQFSLP